MMYKLFAAPLCLMIFFASSPASADPAHDVMQKIAAEEMAAAENQPCTLSLPRGWTSHREAPARLSFAVPYHAGVMGVVETLPAESLENAVAHVAGAFKTELSLIERGDFAQNGVSGTRAVASGRLGGEIWRLLIFCGKLPSGMQIVYYAAAPDRWFGAYEPLFDDILRSLGQTQNESK